MSKYNVGIVGYGVVGKGLHRLLKEYVVAIYDPDAKEFLDYGVEIKTKKENFAELDMVVVSVPTNETEDWSADTSILEDTVKWLGEINPDGIIFIKSTTPPLVVRKFHEKNNKIVVCPEYLGESKYFTPEWKYPHPEHMESHTWQVVGGDQEYTSKAIDILKTKMGVDTRFIQTSDVATASLSKYLLNSFGAMKITFVNEWYDIAETLGVNWNELRELWLFDPRVNRNHTLVFPENRGYGGKCFPKDTRAIIKHLEDEGYSPKLMKTMDEVNQDMREKNRN